MLLEYPGLEPCKYSSSTKAFKIFIVGVFRGIFTAILTFQSTPWSIFTGIIAVIIALAFAFAAAADLFMISKVSQRITRFIFTLMRWFSVELLQIHRMYRSTGASMTKARQEFTDVVLRNQHVRSAASNVAAAAVQSQFSQSNTNNTTNNRY